MKNLLAATNPPDDFGVCILIIILFFIFCCVAIFFLIVGIKRDKNRLVAEKYKIKEMDRIGFEELLKHKFDVANEDTFFYVMLIQLDGMEDLKTTLGERQVKKVFMTMRERIIRVIPKESKICNFDDEHIAVFMQEQMDNIGLANIAMVVISECNKPVTLITRTKLYQNVNIGIAGNSEFSDSAETLLQNVMLATVNSRAGGFNKFEIYSEKLAETQTEEYKHYQEIKEAIKEEQFTLYYQPIIDLNANRVFAYESLVRWKHPKLGLLSPDKFLPIMEQTGDINWIGTFAFEEMLKMQTRHIKERPQDANLIFTLNLSPKQLMYPHLAEEFRKVYKRYRIPAKNICMEIVEFAMFDKVPEVSSNILKLTQMGFKIAIDDFGLEMSSLKTLENLQFDWIKLDRKFIDSSQDDYLLNGLVETLVGFARRKGFIIVAEGVEDEIIRKFISDLHIGYGQGYLFGKPQPPEAYKL